MVYQEKDLRALLQNDLPGEKAHGRMMNYSRETMEDIRKSKKSVKESAVLVLIYQKDDEAHIVLLKRHDYAGPHSGQVGLPGGKKEADDADAIATALRECHEETGVKVERSEIIGALSEIYIPPSNFVVEPFVAFLNRPVNFDFDMHEVRFGIEVPLSDLVAKDNILDGSVTVPTYNQRIKVKHFLFGNEIVWGATAMMLVELKVILTEEPSSWLS